MKTEELKSELEKLEAENSKLEERISLTEQSIVHMIEAMRELEGLVDHLECRISEVESDGWIN